MTQLSPVRAAFRDAMAQIHNYPVEQDWRPAFMLPLDRVPRPTRTPLPDLATPRRSATPFTGRAMTIARAQAAMARGTLSAMQLAQAALAAIAEREDELNAFVYVAPASDILAQAAQLDTERQAGHLRGPLHGIPIAVKDLLAVKDMPNTASSPVLADNIAQADAASIRLLKEAGAIIIGKTQTHEFALGVVTPQSRNPWDASRDPGGSSGGSAIAVTTGMGLAAMATDTRASVRVPAALCGIVGYKPTFGLVPSDGVIMLSWSLDQVCPMAQTVEDAAIMLNVLDTVTQEDYTHYLHKDVTGMRVGLPTAAWENADPDVIAEFRKGVDALMVAGVQVEEIASPSAQDFDLGMLMGLVVSRCEAAAYHLAFADRKDRYAMVAVSEQLDEAAHVSAVDYLQAQRSRADFRDRMVTLLHRYDALLMPTTRVSAPKSDEADEYFLVLSQNCIPWSFIGFPVISLPCGWTPDRLPVGAQLVAGPMEDGRLFALAAALEASLETSLDAALGNGR
jgi:aspartyl-tRNA(Asn)/glutamyl-tRNA(Gln) amidotransferase subunit A